MIVLATRYNVMEEEIPKLTSQDMWQVHNFIYVHEILCPILGIIPLSHNISHGLNINKNYTQVTFTPPN